MGVSQLTLPALGLLATFILLLNHYHNAVPSLWIDMLVVYRGMWLVLLFVFLSGYSNFHSFSISFPLTFNIRFNIFVWEKFNINYLTIFDIEQSKKNGSNYYDFFEVFIFLNILILIFKLLIFMQYKQLIN